MKRIILLSALLLCMTITPDCSAQDLDVSEIVNRANIAAYYSGSDGRANVNMTITDRQGRARLREFTIFRLDEEDGADQKFYVYFKKPEDIRGMVFMVWKHIGKDDDRWLFMPALDLVRRISAGDKRSSFAGSNFLYEDVSGRGITEDAHELVDTTEAHYKIKNVPREGSDVEFAYYYIWINKSNFMPEKAEYYDDRDKLYRMVEALEINDVQGYPTVTKSKVTDLNSGGNTVSEFTDIEYDIGLTEDIFTERYLRRLPQNLLK